MDAHTLQPNHPRPSTDSDSSTDPDFDWNFWRNEHSPSPNLGSPKEPEDGVVPGPDHQSLSADSQPEDPQAAIYAAKGKAKESRHISGTARHVGIAAQRELQPAERSLDPGE